MKHPRSRTGEQGFTLLELLVTLTIAGLLTMVVAPRLNDSVAHARLQASATHLTAALRATRAEAIRTSQAADLAIGADGKSYRTDKGAVVLPAGQTIGFERAANASPGQPPVLEFLADGTSNGGTITIASGGRKAQVKVDWLSGRVSAGE